MPGTQSKLSILKEWFEENQVKYNSSLIELKETKNGLGVIAQADLECDTTLCSIPKSAILSVKNCGIADLLEEAELAGALGLSIALMYERSLGHDSPWYGYLQSLPEREHIPMFWSLDAQKELVGTDLGDALDQDMEFLKDDYETHVKELIQKNPSVFKESKMTFEDFLAATSLVTSRAFRVDAYHKDSMVPLADIFNHRSGAENVHFEANGDVCPECGSDKQCFCMEFGESDQSDEDGEWSDLECEDGCCDDHHAEPDDSDEINSCPSELDDEDDSGNFEEDNDIMEMNIVLACSKGDEVFNTYGPHPNTSLLHRYGFVEELNPFSCIIVTQDEILDAVDGKLTNKRVSQKLKTWNETYRYMVKEVDTILKIQQSGEDEDEQEEFDEDFADDFTINMEGFPSLALHAFIKFLFTKDAVISKLQTDEQFATRYFSNLDKQGWNTGDNQKANATGSSVMADVTRVFKTIALNRLSRYPTSIEKDQEILKSLKENSASYETWSAVTLRYQEKQALTKALQQI